VSRSWRHPIFEGIVIWASDTHANSQVQPAQAMATFAANNSGFKPATAKQMPNDSGLGGRGPGQDTNCWRAELAGMILKNLSG